MYLSKTVKGELQGETIDEARNGECEEESWKPLERGEEVYFSNAKKGREQMGRGFGEEEVMRVLPFM